MTRDETAPVGASESSFRQVLSTGRTVLVLGDRAVDESTPGHSSTVLASLRSLMLSRAGLESVTSSQLTLEQLQNVLGTVVGRRGPSMIRAELMKPPPVEANLSRLLLGPWQRIYDLSGANLSDSGVVQSCVIDATIEAGFDTRVTQLIQMCGSPTTADYSIPTGMTNSARDVWFRQFCADVVSNPVVVVAAASHLELWSLLAVRRGLEGELAGTALLVSEDISPIDIVMCKAHLLVPVKMGIEEFGSLYLDETSTHMRDGRRRLARARRETTGASGPRLVSSLIDASAVDQGWRFLRGYDPLWTDISGGRIARFSRIRHVWNKLKLDDDKRNTVLVKGRAGSGKTAALMRLGHELQGKGLTVVWIDRSVNMRIAEIVDRVIELEPHVVLIDDVEIFGDASQSLVRRLCRNGKSAVVATVRRTQIWAVQEDMFDEVVDGHAPLTDSDLRLLIKRLEQAGLLGSLTGVQPDEARVDQLSRLCQRDLLSALIEIVTGEQFETRVQSEVNQLSPIEREVYIAICLSENIYERYSFPENDLLQTVGKSSNFGLFANAVENLIADRKLAVRMDGGLLARHRAIADAVVKSVPAQEIASFVTRMLSLYASRAAGIRDQSNPDRRSMVYLLSHTRMRRLKLSPASVRDVYKSVQSLLKADFHFWLQRGSFEVEHGDLDLAESYLASARGCEGGGVDRLVTTEWGFMRFRKAIRSPGSDELCVKAMEALSQLMNVARTAGSSSPHTFTVIIRHGTDWLSSAQSLGDADKLRVAGDINAAMELAKLVCAGSHEIRRATEAARPGIEIILGLRSAPSPKYPL